MMTELLPLIVADVGGTNARFALVTEVPAETVKLEYVRVFESSSFSGFTDLLDSYIATLDGVKPRGACLSIAGPIIGDSVNLTNLRWDFSIEAERKRFDLQRLVCINDFASLSYSVLSLTASEQRVIKPGVHQPQLPRLVMGPGTGLGVAGLVHSASGWLPVPGEGGHVTFAPSTPGELEIRRAIAPDDEHISLERFLSGPGLVNLHRALCEIQGKTYEPMNPADISSAALDGADPLCVEAIEVFCEILGSAAGNACLMFGAVGGVYLGGGILPRIEGLLLSSRFAARFVDKGRMQPLLQQVPVTLMKSDQASLRGAANWMMDREQYAANH
jgi:glucokinase